MMTFLAPTSLPVGSNPAGIAVGDYNSDGKADMAVVDQTTSTINLMISNGDGTFQNSGSYSAGLGAIDAAFGDFNQDGKNDVAVVSTGGTVNVELSKGPVTSSDFVLWRHNQGMTVSSGTNGDADQNGVVDDSDYSMLRHQFGKPLANNAFAPPASYTVGAGSHAINVGDFNNDGKLDIATMNGSTASVLLGNGDGTFQPHNDTAIPGNSTNLVVGDFDKDGYLDMATSNTLSNGTITILKGHGDGTFAPATSVYAFSAPVYLAVGDFNHDGYDDFAVTNSYVASSMSVIMNHGDGTYDPPHTYNIPETGYEIQVEDFDHDGNDDFAVRGSSEYMVQLGNGDGTFLPAVTYATPSGRFEMGTHGDFDGDGAVDLAYASTGGVTVMMNANDSSTNLAGAVGFKVAAPATTTSGSAMPVTVTVVDAAGNVVPGFQGTIYVTSSDAAAHTSVAYRFRAGDSGVHTFTDSIRLVTTGDQTVTVSSPLLPSFTQTVNVTPAITRLAVSAPTASTAGDTFNVTVTAYDALGNVGAGYTSTVHFSSSDVAAGLPADYAFTAADAGVHTFAVTLKTAGHDFLNVSEIGRTVNGGSFVDVSPAAVAALQLGGPSGAIGVARPITIVAQDSFGNLVSSYSGTVHITSSDPAAVLPADVSLVNGVATTDVTLLTVGAQTITATDINDSTLFGTMSSDATPPVAAKFGISGFPNSTAGDSDNFTITVTDTIGQIATGYTGTIYFSSSDMQAGLPASYTFTAADAGVHTFSATLKTAGTQSITAYDPSNGLTGSQAGITVSPAAFSSLKVSTTIPPDEGTSGQMLVLAGQTIPLTVKAQDAFGNAVTSYTGTIAITSTDTQAGLPTAYKFTAADAGVHTFSVDLKTATPNGEVWAFTVTDTSDAATLATLSNFEVVNAAASRFVVTVPSTITSGSPFLIRVSAFDAFGNRAKNYFGTIHFSNTASLLGLPADYSFTSLDSGDHTFTATLSTEGIQTLSITNLADNSLATLVTVNVAAPATGGGGGGGGGGNGGTGGGGGGGGKVG